MQNQHPAVVRAAALKKRFCPQPPQPAEVTAPTVESLEARANKLRAAIASYEAQLKDPQLSRELDLSPQYEALIDEAEAEIDAIYTQIESPASAPKAPARKFYYSNTAYQKSVEQEYYGRGYTSDRRDYRSSHIWRVGKPNQPVNETFEEGDEDPFFHEDGEPQFVAHCESREIATALCALLNRDDSFLNADG